MTTITSPITLQGFMQSTVLSVSFVNDNAYVTDADGREQQAHKGFTLPNNIDFSFNAGGDGLGLMFFMKDENNCVGDVPYDAMDLDHIPGFERYMKKAGFEMCPEMENCVSISISNPSKVKFANTDELLAKLTGLLEMIGGSVPGNIDEDGEIIDDCGYGTEDFNEFKDAFDADPTIINQQ